MTNETTGHGPDYEAWAAQIETDQRPARPSSKALRGDAARAYARDLLADVAETPDEITAVERTAGRPSLDTSPGPSPMWKLRAPKDLDTQVRALAAAQGRSVSEVLREAASEYLARHAS
ncbi:ribbon-helix-helix protein, CopG family [Luteimicrobium subarcticum]|uniref:Ribbon-helix-helix CopG family protein n=1 Tax=Luteimicrobium subarcticum TaxID=620910 RepID=A0A2M8WJD4_9MICO|nr:ribbon-helix-helix protein, CopG family [Luteimicrobium subarcticum]PJI91039.1 ribbon-helix-helix CopG family protein [Luteimicrobium subarcticum]